MPIHVTISNVDELANNVFTMFKENAQKRNMTYQLQSELKGSQYPIDRTYLEMMLTNLLSNAFKFTPDGGTIILSLNRAGKFFQISVKDNGVGIPPAKLSRIFERFYQVDDQQKGSGIGLSLVKCLVEKHHGTISVSSEPQQGTEFRILLPVELKVFTPEEIVDENDEKSLIQQTNSLAKDTLMNNEQLHPQIMEDVALEEDDSELEGMTETILLVDDNKEMVISNQNISL